MPHYIICHSKHFLLQCVVVSTISTCFQYIFIPAADFVQILKLEALESRSHCLNPSHLSVPLNRVLTATSFDLSLDCFYECSVPSFSPKISTIDFTNGCFPNLIFYLIIKSIEKFIL